MITIAIITSIKDENERSFIEELYIKHNKVMWKYAMSLTKNKDEADELIQISFEKIIRCIDAVKEINCCKMDSYMVSIVRNSYNTLLRKKYKEKTQFILISHRRGTMENADTLYGVTMPEKGISKIVSLRVNDVIKD